MSFIQNLQHRFKQGNIVEKLIYINIAIFVFTALTGVFQELYKHNNGNFIVNWFSLDANYYVFFSRPWTIISYGFLHGGFIHVLFNLITLFFIGNLFVDYFSQKQLLIFYVAGTFFGGFFYLLGLNYFPLFEGTYSNLVGASAGIAAIFIGISTHIPNYSFKFPLIGFVKLWHLAAIWLVLQFLGASGGNAGGNFSHLGGALFGYLYIKHLKDNKTDIFSAVFSLFKQKKKPLKTVYRTKKKVQKTENTSEFNQQKIDTILDKIGKSGYDALSKEEKEFLFKQGK